MENYATNIWCGFNNMASYISSFFRRAYYCSYVGLCPPFEMIADHEGHLMGFEIDIMNEICKRLDNPCAYKTLPFENLLNQVEQGIVDLAIAGITITAERQARFLFSSPFLISKMQAISTTDNVIKEFSDIHGKRIGVEKESVFKNYSKTNFSENETKEYSSQNDLFAGIVNNEIDVILLDEISARYWMTNSSNNLKLVGNSVPIGVGYGIIANKNQVVLISKVNDALRNMAKDGTYLTIYNRYF